MADFGFDIKVPKAAFFDRKAVIDAVGRGRAKALSRAGAFIRTTAQRSMRPGGKKGATSPPGVPPRTHAGDLRRLIFFAMIRGGDGVRIGPVKYRKGEAPALLEFGGTAVRTDAKGKKYRAKYKGNPFMRPALQKEADKGTIAAAWKGVVRS